MEHRIYFGDYVAVEHTMLDLTISTMAQFGVEGHFSIELVLNAATVAAGLVFDVLRVEPFTPFVYLVRGLIFPIVLV